MKFILYDYPVVGSTNDQAKLLLQQGGTEGTVVRAGRQTAGRGRRGRHWISEPGNLYCSLILTPECPLIVGSQLSFVIAIAAGKTILPFLQEPQQLSYKWPNDLLLQNKKVGGILIEAESEDGQLAESCIVGIGMNITSAPAPQAYPVTALNQHTKMNISCDILFPELLNQIKLNYQLWKEKGFEPVRKEWLQRAYSLDQEMSITLEEKKITGIFKGLSPEGALLLEREDGLVDKFMSAEVS